MMKTGIYWSEQNYFAVIYRAVEALLMMVDGRTTCRSWLEACFKLIISIRVWAAFLPISTAGCVTVVREGCNKDAISRLEKLITFTFTGICNPRSLQAL